LQTSIYKDQSISLSTVFDVDRRLFWPKSVKIPYLWHVFSLLLGIPLRMFTFVTNSKSRINLKPRFMLKAKQGDNVKVHYTGRLKDGTIFDSSEGKEPLGFQIGAGQMIKGFDTAVDGLEMGKKITAEIPAAEAYGEVNEELYFDVPKNNLPEDLKPEIGQQLAMTQPNGQQVPVKVKEIKEDIVVIDANHDLAGKDLIFDIELVEIA
jgi:peptidylprolyl isomerase